MFDTGNKPAWLLPLAILIIPGTCYAFVAIIPSYRSDFAILGIGLTGLLFIMAIWRVLQPRQTETHGFRSVAAHGVCLPIMFFAYRFWNTLAPTLSLVIGIALFIIYLSSWLAPFWAPKVSQYFYRDVFWFPNLALARIMIFVTLLAFAYSFYTGLHISEYGTGSILFAASTMTIGQVAATFYFSAQLQRQKQGKEPFPLEAE
jgi:hypothetical protein